MKKTLSIISLGLVLAAMSIPSAGAAEREGHGGRVWKCLEEDGSTTYELLDYRLGRERWKLDIALPAGETEMDVIRAVLARVAHVEPSRAAIYLDRAEHFMDRVKFVDQEFLNLSDVRSVLIKPDNCDLKQVVHQIPRDARIAGEDPKYRFYATRKIWNPLTVAQRAGVILHEIAYEDAVAQGHEDSDETMYLNATLASAQMTSLGLDVWLKTLSDIKHGYHYGNLLINPNPDSTAFHPESLVLRSGYIKQTKDETENHLAFRSQTLVLNGLVGFHPDGNFAFGDIAQPVHWIYRGAIVKVDQNIELHPDGKLSGSRSIEPESPIGILASRTWTAIGAGPLAEDANRQVRMFVPAKDLRVNREGGKARFHQLIILDENDEIRGGMLAESAKLRDTSGRKRKFEEGSFLQFDARGQILSNGIYSTKEQERFIRIDRLSDDRYSFEFCDSRTSKCERLGRERGYSFDELRIHLRLSLWAPGWLGRTYGAMMKSDSPGKVVLGIMGGSILSAVALGPIGVLGFIGATMGPAITETVYENGLANRRDATDRDRAIKKMLKEECFYTDLSIDVIADQLVKSLQTIP